LTIALLLHELNAVVTWNSLV